MSIETRLNAINDHLVDDYSVLTLAGADLTNVDKNIVNLKPTWKERLLYFINNGTDTVWDNWEKVVGEGTSLTLNNTEEAPMKVLLKGNTYQDSTTQSANIMDTNILFQEMLTYNSNQQSPPTRVTADNKKCIRFYSSAYMSALFYQGKFKANTQYTIRTLARIYDTSITSGNALFIQIIYTDETYKNVSVQANGSNWNALRVVSDGSKTIDHFRFSYGTAQNWLIDEESFNIIEGDSTNYVPFVPDSPSPDYPQEVHVVSGDNEVEVSNGDNTQSTTYPINLPEGMFLGSIGDYKDTFFKAEEGNPIYDSLDSATKQTLDSNEWYLEKKIGKVVLNGTETWGGSSANGYYYALNEMLRTNDYRLAIKSNYYTIGQDYRSGYHEDKQMTGYYVTTQSYPGQNWLYIFDTSYSDKTALATWLSTHNTEVYYVLATPTYTKIEGTLASQLEEVYRAKSEEGQTNISQTNDDLPFVLSVSALSQEV